MFRGSGERVSLQTEQCPTIHINTFIFKRIHLIRICKRFRSGRFERSSHQSRITIRNRSRKLLFSLLRKLIRKIRPHFRICTNGRKQRIVIKVAIVRHQDALKRIRNTNCHTLRYHLRTSDCPKVYIIFRTRNKALATIR